LFLVMQCAIVLGMLSSCLQISTKISQIKNNTNTPNTYIKATSSVLSDKFVYDYFISHLDDQNKINTNDGIAFTTNYYKISYDVTLNGQEIFDEVNNKNLPEAISNAKSDPNISLDSTKRLLNRIRKSINNISYNLKNSSNTRTVFSDVFEKYVREKNDDYNFTEIIYNDIFNSLKQFYRGQHYFNFTLNPKVLSSKVTLDANNVDFSDNDSISSVYLFSGRKPLLYDGSSDVCEAVISQAYFKANKLELGDIVATLPNGLKIKVVGVGANYETIANGSGFNVLNGSDIKTY